MKIVFVVNNKNKRLQNELPGLNKCLEEGEIGLTEILFTTKGKHAIELAREATERECDFLIGVGGDGTLHELINGVLLSNIPSESYPAIGLLPWGSANDFARTVGVSNSPDELIRSIKANSTKKIDLGKIVLHQTKEIRYFINIAGLGLGAEVVKGMEQTTSRLGPGFNYFKHIITGFFRYSKKEVSCNSGDWKWKGKLLQMAVANGRYFGNAICVAPDAVPDDGVFQVVIFGNLSIWDYLKNLRNLKKGTRIKHSEVHYYKAKEIVLESEEPCGIEADGEYVGILPATISILPGAISFLMPSDSR
ncbi:diacylglycerol kinase family protein [Muriicola sp. E247]|uniref:diacylglycerol/lipid kinase family protein n=1 Tax=Muriicola sp. E247 TaxID=3242730 RepID=UPI0035268843